MSSLLTVLFVTALTACDSGVAHFRVLLHFFFDVSKPDPKPVSWPGLEDLEKAPRSVGGVRQRRLRLLLLSLLCLRKLRSNHYFLSMMVHV